MHDQYSSPWKQWVIILKVQDFTAMSTFLEGEAHLLKHVDIVIHCCI